MIPEYQTYLSRDARERRRWFIALLVLAALSYAAFVLVLLGPAWGHDAKPSRSQPLGWAYGWECCNLMDCREVSEDIIEETPQGYVYKVTGELIPYGDKKIKQSKDEYYHLCTKQGKEDTAIICLYTPNRGF